MSSRSKKSPVSNRGSVTAFGCGLSVPCCLRTSRLDFLAAFLGIDQISGTSKSACKYNDVHLHGPVKIFLRITSTTSSKSTARTRSDCARRKCVVRCRVFSLGRSEEFYLGDAFWPQPTWLLHFPSVELFPKSCSPRLRHSHEWARGRHEMFQFRKHSSPGGRD